MSPRGSSVLRILLLAAVAGSGPAHAVELERLAPAAPPDGAVVGSRPAFHVAYEGPAQVDPRELRLRITLEPLRDDDETRAYVFDRKRGRRGWYAGDEGEIVYRPRRPLRDGAYRWRVDAWNGVDWSPGLGAFELRIDSVPPADVEGLRVLRDNGTLLLDWAPVVLDRNGRPEYVARYHVYRYRKRVFPPGAKSYEAGVVEQPRFIDRGPFPDDTRALYYRVVAEDLAGNQAGRRE